MRRSIHLLLVALTASVAAAAPRPNGVAMAAAGGGAVNLPHNVMDANGNQWMIYHGGWLQMQGNTPLYSQTAVLTLNGNQPGSRTNRARLDEKTGELIFDLVSPQGQGLTITRRILIHRKDGYVRYIDSFKNNQAQDQAVALQLQTNLNFGINSAQIITDPRKKDRNLAWVALTDNNNLAAVELFASRGAKVSPEITWQPGNNSGQITYQLTVPAGKEVAVLHVHAVSPGGADAGSKLVEELKPNRILADVPPDLRKTIINFVAGGGMVGDFEVLRGDLFDVVELRGGDQYKGTLQDPAYKLETFYGAVELPADRVVGLINVGDFRPRQLLVTAEGEIFGGRLAADVVRLQLSSGQVTQIPLSQVARLGYRKRPGEPEEWTLNKPMVVLRSGDRVQVELPARPVEVTTRYGRLALDPKSVAALVLAAEDHGVHEILLADGSRFAGLVSTDAFEMTLAGTGRQPVRFPANAVSRIQLSPPSDAEPADDAPAMELTNEDRLVGQVDGQLKLDTSFDTLTINGPEVKKLVHPADAAAMDVQVTLWDDSTVSGQLQQPDIPVRLASGVTISVPVALVREYTHPEPVPSAPMAERIRTTVAELSADDYKRREQAEAQLLAMGPAVARVLKELRGAQPPEAQQRIDSVLKQLETDKKSSGPVGRPTR